MRSTILLCSALLLGGCSTMGPGRAPGHDDLMVPVTSTAPSMRGQPVQLYVRHIAPPASAGPAKAVVFVHGSGTPAEVSFDSRRREHSWLAYVAQAGFHAYSVDMTGYGRSTRPAALNDPCNLSPEQQARFIPSMIPAPCSPSHPQPMTTMSSDWDDINAVVDHVRRLHGIPRVSLVGWSQGGPRVAGFTALHPEKVDRIVVLAPAYNRTSLAAAPNPLPNMPATMTVQSQSDFIANWDRQVGCPNQYDPGAAAQIWQEMQESDPVGARWGPGVRRAPNVPTWGFNQATVRQMRVPFLMVTGEHDKQVLPERVRELYQDWGGGEKVLVEMACSSHNAMWEANRRLLYEATVDWLRDGRVGGTSNGVVRLGY